MAPRGPKQGTGICLYSSACAKSVSFTLSGECFSSGKSVTYSLEDLDGCLEMIVGLGSIGGWKHSHGVAMTPADEEGCEKDMWKQPGPRVPKADYTSLSASGNTRLWLDKYTRGWRKCCKVKKSQITVSSSYEHSTREQSLYLQEFVPTNPSSCTHCVMACKKPAPAKRVSQIFWQY